MKRLYFINPKGSHQSHWSLKTITIRKQTKTPNIVRITVFSRKWQGVGIENPSLYSFPRNCWQPCTDHTRVDRPFKIHFAKPNSSCCFVHNCSCSLCIKIEKKQLQPFTISKRWEYPIVSRKKGRRKIPLLLNNHTFLRGKERRGKKK